MPTDSYVSYRHVVFIVRASDTDEITFMEAGIGATRHIGPTGTGPDGDEYPVSYNRGYTAGSTTFPCNQGQLDTIVFKDGTVWNQAAIWSHLSGVVTWSYPYGSAPQHPYGYGEYGPTTFLPYVEKTYLQAFTDYAAANAPPSSPGVIPPHDALLSGAAHFQLSGDLVCWA